MASKREFGSTFVPRAGRWKKPNGSGPASLGSTSMQRYGLPTEKGTEATLTDQRFENARKLDELEARFGFERYNHGPERLGWLVNIHAILMPDDEWPGGRAAVDCYFIDDEGDSFKISLLYSPYFYIGCKPGTEAEVEEFLRRKFEHTIEKIARVEMEDLKQPNHLVGKKRLLLKLFFRNVSDLLTVRKVVLPAVQQNQRNLGAKDVYADVKNDANPIRYEQRTESTAMSSRRDINRAIDNITDIREYDVPYYVRVAIDLDIRVGVWYTAQAQEDETVILTRRPELVHRPEPVVLAFDIETTKLPLKFPDANIDSVMMISYMIDGRGYLITNRDIVSQDIEDFDYTPKPEFEGPFTIFNEANEHDVILRFFRHIQEAKPTIYVTYNGDFFDWPFIEARAKANGIDMYQEIGVYKDSEDEYKCKHASHMDALRWVKRDSYLPQGSQGLKAVTTAKLGYNPMELDPEDMTRFAAEQPQTLAQYSVSDAVATYYLYMKYVHPFIFSLCNIIPLIPDEVLRKGTGTLCELLLMVEAYKVNVVFPNKHVEESGKMFEGHLLESETYVGGHVEALEAGVFRSDIATDFKLDPSGAQELLDQLDNALKFTIQVEEKQKLEDVVNYDQVRQQIKEKLEHLRDNPIRNEEPLIYHLDVAAMYPNIILTNRLQPDAMVDESMCATCEFNRPGKTCDRRMTWSWRGEYYPAKRNEYNMIKNQLMTENFPAKIPDGPPRTWNSLTPAEQDAHIQKRLTAYCKKVYKRVRSTKTMERESIICQRENPFYIGTVRAFRDRRYEYKGLHKQWKQNLDKAISAGEVTKIDEAKKMIVLYDSLQLAHKCILNSFYGYVMRKGARWHSLEMAGIVCLTGAKIIQMARQLVERLGRPLELDTDGIWCILPKSFPETFTFELANGKKLKIHYPCTMLNHLVHDKFTNHQYQTLVNPETFEYKVHSENSIFFEIDGPYRAMILPASTHEDRLLKKRYAVFNENGSLAELKGFEVKRRGELKLVKIFQSNIFKVFLEGKTLEECYASVARVADQWLDILFSKGVDLNDEELFDLISENRSMSKTLDDYGSQKSTSISTAKRLAEFLGDEMVKDKGLACRFIISARPYGLPVSERAIPVTIFSAEPKVKEHFLRLWLKDDGLTNFDIRDILDWPYYLERFGSVIQKLITIPAAMQHVRNPVPRVRHPDWLFKRVAAKDDKLKQYRITDMFSRTESPLSVEAPDAGDMMDDVTQDIEELTIGGQSPMAAEKTGPLARVTRNIKRKDSPMQVDESPEFELPAVMPDMHSDYHGWLAYQKIKWKRQRVERQKRRELYGESGTQARQSVGDYFRRQTGSLVSSTWEILQIAETHAPDEFVMWIYTQGRLCSVRLAVPRIVYVNTRESTPVEALEDPAKVIRCVKSLPRSHVLHHLFEITLPEATFQSQKKVATSIFNRSATEGVYETQVPLLIRAVLQLGSRCKVNQTKCSRMRLEDTFNLLDLVSPLTSTSPYIGQPSNFHYLFLYHVHSDSRHFFALVGATLPQARCFVVGVSQNSQQLPNVNRLYKQRYEAWQQSMEPRSDTVNVDANMAFETTFHSSEAIALNAINRVLRTYLDSKRGPTILTITSPRSHHYLVQHARFIAEMPCLTLPSLEQDNRLQALGWLQPTVIRMLDQYIGLGTRIDERLHQARYANVPLCNIPNDPAVFLADVTFARQLTKNDMVLWWSQAGKPDLGGREDDDSIYGANAPVNPELCNRGMYDTVCVEMDMFKLCLNTLLEAPVVNELEGTTGLVGFDSTTNSLETFAKGGVDKTAMSFDEGTISNKTFTMLRTVVQQWFKEAISKEKTVADLMIHGLHRWLKDPESSMHDPCLYGVVHFMMKKIFMQLVAEFKRMGASIVFANFHKIIVSTGKDTLENAKPYGEYLLRSINAKQVFEVLDLRLVNHWSLMIWMDEMNYGGILANDPLEPDAEPTVSMQWNIQDYLPPAVQSMFVTTVADYVHHLHHCKMAHPRLIRSQAAKDMEERKKDDPRIGEKQQYVKTAITRRVLGWIPDVVKKQTNREAGFAFPQLSGSHLSMTNPALECVKFICAVLGLDSDIEDQVLLLKRNGLLSINGTSDFSPEAQFRNPCEYFKLTDVICMYCNYTADLDFCRDRKLLPINGEIQPWRCQSCHVEYDKKLIEERMISQVEQWLAGFQLQDLECGRCHTIKRENLINQCQRCGSEFVARQDKNELRRKLKVFSNIAHEQRLLLLSEIVDWTLSNL